MEKMLSFPNWFEDQIKNHPEDWVTGTAEEDAKRGWDAARIGMIPDSEAVRIPPVSEWPDDAIAIHLSYASATAQYTGMQIIRRFPRVETKGGYTKEQVYEIIDSIVKEIKNGIDSSWDTRTS